ncbi:MAG: hypothetical protein J6D30_03605 [Clostridia bacterium]|nr:hypothetical protein [Clostridia bacterium]
MKKMNTKIMALALSLSLAAATAGTLGVVTANAAIKETIVGDNVLTTTGDINGVDWILSGDTAETSFTKDVQGDILVTKDAPWAVGYLSPWDATTFANGAVKMELDVFEFNGGAWRPFVGTGVTSPLDSVWYNGEVIDLGAHAGNTTKAVEFYTDETLTTTYAPGVWYYAFGAKAYEGDGYHFEMIFTPEGALGFKSSQILTDGTLGPVNQVWLKNAFTVNATDNYYFGLNYWGSLKVDNFKVSTSAGTIFETNFSGTGWNENEGIPTSGKMYNPHGKVKSVAEVIAKPANTDRMVTDLEIVADENLNEVFNLSGTIDFRTLGKKFGMAIGLDDQNGAINAEGTSYVYFSQVEGVTYVTVVNDGVEGTPVSLEGDYLTGEFFDFELKGMKNGSTLTIGEKTVTLDIKNFDGYFAFVTDGEGEAEVALGGDTRLVKYVYRASDGEAIANNFNSGYVNPANWESNSVNAVMVDDPTQAKGLLYEDGVVKFEGTADGSYFGTSEAYADYVLEFLYTEKNDADKPALKAEWIHGYSPLSLNLGVKQPGGGWAKSTMIMFKAGLVQMQNFNGTPDPVNLAIDYTFAGAAAGETKTTAVKVVVANNTITVYYQEVVADTAPTTAAFIKAGTFNVDDTYGRIAFATTDSGYFMLDDVRVTPIDSPDPAQVTANAEAHADFAPIADEYRPYTLEAPEITMEGTTVAWEAVEGATGYVVNVNGNETTVGADVLSFVVDCSTPGDYAVTVKALGNGAHISDSSQSEAITFTVQAAGGEDSSQPTTSEPADSSQPTTSEPENSEPAKGGLFDCNGVVASTMIPTLAAFAVAMLLKKRKED